MWSHRISWIYFAQERVRGTLIISIYGMPLTGGNRGANSRLLLATYININALICIWIFLIPIQLTFLAIPACHFLWNRQDARKLGFTFSFQFQELPATVPTGFFNCKLSVNYYFSCLFDMKLQGIVNLQSCSIFLIM